MLLYHYNIKNIYFYYHKKWLNRSEQFIMADKKCKIMRNAGWWTKNKLELFEEVLADPDKKIDISLEKLALKKSANNEVFEHVKNTFEIEMDHKSF